MNARKIVTRTAVTCALIAVPLVAVVGTASADPIHDNRGPQQNQPNFQNPQLQLPNFGPTQPAPAPQPGPAPTTYPNYSPNFFQGLSTGSAG